MAPFVESNSPSTEASTGTPNSPISTNDYYIRPARSADVAYILDMIRSLASHLHMSTSVHTTTDALLNFLDFSDRPHRPQQKISCTAKAILIFSSPSGTEADAEEVPAGMAIYYPTFSTFLGQPGIYLEDLFVNPAYRRRGFGRALIAELARITKEIGGARLEWTVAKRSENTREFYRTLGGREMDDWIGVRIQGNEVLDTLCETMLD